MADDLFQPPDAERFAAHLQQHAVRPPSFWQRRGPLAVLLGAIVVSLLFPGALALVLPWAALGGVLIYLQVRSRKMQRLQAQARAVQELTMMRRAPDALRVGWSLLPQLTVLPTLHGRTIAAMAHCLDLAEAHEAAIVGYDYLLRRMPTEHPGSLQLRIQRAISALFADRLTDADDALRALRNSLDRIRDTPMHAGFLLAQLIQDVRTHHFAEALTLCNDWTAALRPLGVEAGYGHALVALCHRQTDRADDAEHYWRSATTLLPAGVLLHRFPELKPLV